MIIIYSFIIDLLIGDPFRFHPVIVIGNTINKIEKIIYKDSKLRGLILTVSTLIIFLVPTYLLRNLLPNNISIIIELYLIYSLLATKSLYVETAKVKRALKDNDIKKARKELSYLVSRDTFELDEMEIKKALLETISENIIDGIISPLFYAMIGYFFNLHLEFIITYKIVNTLDSMVGYTNDRYNNFGFFSAKFDDLLNFFPARFGSILMLITGMFVGNIRSGVKIFLRDRKKSVSINAAHSESVVAGLFEVELLGPAKYFGNVIEKSRIGVNKNAISEIIINKTYIILFTSPLVLVFIFLGALYGIK